MAGGTRKTGQWKDARQMLPGLAGEYRDAQIKATRQEAELFRKRVLEAFKTSGRSSNVTWQANEPSTIRRKKSDKPLIDKGDLIGSVTIIEVGPGEFFAGVPNNARSPSGRLTQIGKVHEFGQVIVQKLKKGVRVIKIPERSFLRSTKAAHFDGGKSRKRVQARVAKFMRRATGATRRTL